MSLRGKAALADTLHFISSKLPLCLMCVQHYLRDYIPKLDLQYYCFWDGQQSVLEEQPGVPQDLMECSRRTGNIITVETCEHKTEISTHFILKYSVLPKIYESSAVQWQCSHTYIHTLTHTRGMYTIHGSQCKQHKDVSKDKNKPIIFSKLSFQDSLVSPFSRSI